ncbi:MAG TPA: hypothetical protein VKQ32_07725 [Polyangia bacterium]|nr:hypothetical protein [Polyangia bacterium]
MKTGRTAGILFIALGFVLTLLLQRSFLVQSDEGYTLNAAWQMWNGMKMYDDFRLFVAPGAGYAVFLAWKLAGGPSFLAARALSLAFAFSSSVAVFLILTRRGVRAAVLAVSVAAWAIAGAQYVMLNHNTFSSYAAAWLLFLLVRAADREGGSGRRWLVDHALIGVAAGAVFLFHQTKGPAVLLASIALVLSWARGARRVQAAAAVVAGFAAVVAPLLLVWRPSVLVREWFIVPLSNDYLGHTGASRPLAVACVLVVVGMVAVAMLLRDRTLMAVAAIQTALLASIIHNVESRHVAINSFPLIVFVPLALRQYAARTRPSAAPPVSQGVLTTFGMALIVMFAFGIALPNGRPVFKESTLYVDFIRRVPRNIFPSPRVAAARAIYAGPFMPGLYFALGKSNPFFVSETVVCDPACQQRLVAQLADVKPEIAFLNYTMIRHLGYQDDNPVDAYFRDRYVLCGPTAYEGMIVRAVSPGWCP